MTMLAAAVLGQQGAVAGGGVAVVDTAAWSQTSLATTHAFDLPTGFGSGDVLVAVWRGGGGGAITATTPTGWTAIYSATTNGGSYVWAKTATGAEGSTETTTSDVGTYACVTTYAVSGAHGDVEVASTWPTFSSDPPSLTPAWGSAENLWITGISNRSAPSTGTQPSGYGDLVSVATTETSVAGCSQHTAHRVLTASAEDPGAWGLSGTWNRQYAFTIAVRPA